MRGQERSREASNPADRTGEAAPCIRTDRLSSKQLRVWKAIEAIVFAKDASGRLRCPGLHSLWRWVEESGHVVQVELPDRRARGDHQAGKFRLETVDPNGKKHIAAIRICLPVIDGALVRKRVRGVDRFIRFEGLGKMERYAEILGHELAHAVWALGDQSHARLIGDLDREARQFDNLRRHAAHAKAWDQQTQQHLKRIQAMTAGIEKPAEMAEEAIWRELRGRRRE